MESSIAINILLFIIFTIVMLVLGFNAYRFSPIELCLLILCAVIIFTSMGYFVYRMEEKKKTPIILTPRGSDPFNPV